MNNNFLYDRVTIDKFSSWAEALSDDIDFIDYWYNLFLSDTKHEIDKDILNSINAFYWTRWKEDFEEFVDRYEPQKVKVMTASFGTGLRALRRS